MQRKPELEKIIIRRENELDHRVVEHVTREAFWGKEQPGCDEHLLVRKLRACRSFVPALDCVAIVDQALVGSILYSKCHVVSPNGTAHELLTFGPLSVLPSYQQRGVGYALVSRTLLVARGMGYRGVVITGHPAYYARFGFQPAAQYGMHLGGRTFDALMALSLEPGGLDGIHGEVRFDPVFDMLTPEAVAAYDVQFPPKTKRVMPTLDVITDRLPDHVRQAMADAGITSVVELSHKSRRELAALDGVGESEVKIMEQALEELGYPRRMPGER